MLAIEAETAGPLAKSARVFRPGRLHLNYMLPKGLTSRRIPARPGTTNCNTINVVYSS